VGEQIGAPRVAAGHQGQPRGAGADGQVDDVVRGGAAGVQGDDQVGGIVQREVCHRGAHGLHAGDVALGHPGDGATDALHVPLARQHPRAQVQRG